MTASSSLTWAVERISGPAAELHARAWPDPPARRVEILSVTTPALVLGSTQAESVVDHTAADEAGFDVVRRRSGGGAVLMVPGESLWIDVVLPPWDDLWVDDVGRSFHWLGQVWVDALADLGFDTEVHDGGLCTTEWSRLVCWGGLGSGEVTMTPGANPSKIVGMAQRRGREGARFQCAVHRRWDPERLLALLVLSPEARHDAAVALADAGAEVAAPTAAIIDAVLHHLPV